MSVHPLSPAAGTSRTARLGGAWLRSITVVPVETGWQARTAPDEETLLVVLSGTFDLFAGGSSWLQRGLRATPFAGRPCGLYLPPGVEVRVAGQGEVLLVAALRPKDEEKQPDPASMPLLPLAGSGKAFDSRTGTWQLLERFPSAPEAVLPRAIERTAVEGVAVERVFPYAFKAQALCLDEAVVAPGQSVVLPRPHTPPGTSFGDELAVFVRAEQACTVGDGERHRVTGEAVVTLDAARPPRIDPSGGRAYVVAVWAGRKPT
ncbi:MAG TPA: 5-deoxy-glucuronate isomerase [Planctomycetota bacterium]|nr:5-deoxy-glucuronate isomerase [Planctomycetota bacterium]